MVSHISLSVEQDPLNSGDDVIEQDIPDLFDTENIIVCQYDKVRYSDSLLPSSFEHYAVI